MSKCKTCGTPSTYIKGVRKLREQLSKQNSIGAFQKTVIKNLETDLGAIRKQNTSLVNKLHRLEAKYKQIAEEVEVARRKEKMLAKLEENLAKKIEKASEEVIKEHKKRARAEERLLKIRRAAKNLYGMTK